jgi:hypothetical protein
VGDEEQAAAVGRPDLECTPRLLRRETLEQRTDLRRPLAGLHRDLERPAAERDLDETVHAALRTLCLSTQPAARQRGERRPQRPNRRLADETSDSVARDPAPRPQREPVCRERCALRRCLHVH